MRLDKRRAAAVVLVPAALLLGLATQAWATGETSDVLRHGSTSVTGTEAAPGVIGLALVAVAALLGLMTGGRVIKAVSAGVLLLASLGTAVLVVLVVASPAQSVAAQVARELARTTSPEATGATTAGGWLGLLTALLLLVGAIAAVASSRTWAGLSGRYERVGRAEAGPRGQVRTAWDEMTEGGDPTLRDGPERT
jgi:hypothetical protein